MALALPWEPDEPETHVVIANGFLAVECVDGATAFASSQLAWPFEQDPGAEVCVRISFIMKAAGAGSDVRLAAQFKSISAGGDSSLAFAPEGFVAVPVNYATLGEVFSTELMLDASGFVQNDAVGVHVGLDGSNSMGAGTDDDADVPIQLISIEGAGGY